MKQEDESRSCDSSFYESFEYEDGSDRIINPETNDIEGIIISEEIDGDYKPKTYSHSNNLKDEKIICIEMKNNNKIYTEYKDNWTIRDVKLHYLNIIS